MITETSEHHHAFHSFFNHISGRLFLYFLATQSSTFPPIFSAFLIREGGHEAALSAKEQPNCNISCMASSLPS